MTNLGPDMPAESIPFVTHPQSMKLVRRDWSSWRCV
jgi:hypothetical protein